MNSILLFLLLGAAAGALAGFVLGVYAERYRGVPLWQREDRWSIGMRFGTSPLHLPSDGGASNPVLTARDVTDLRAAFVADPFMVREGATWYMFFEVLDADSYRGKISLATSESGTDWTYRQVVLDEPFHLSYPHVVRWKDNYYMVPESYSANSVRLYKAVEFPLRWIHVGDLLPGALVDASLFEHAGQWWMFAADQKGNNRLRLFRADTLLGPWSEHPASPVVQDDARIARPGGRVVTHEGRIYRYTQDCVENYGVAVRVFEITRLDALHYEEREAAPEPLVQASGNGWNRDGMHHIDAHHMGDDRWMACVDGNRMKITFRLSW